MAKRYSGEVEVSIIWNDNEEQYAAKVTAPGPRDQFVMVGAPAVLEVAVDSPEGYDSAARAAIAFADNEDEVIGDYAAYTSEGCYISRSKDSKWPSQP